MRDARPASFQKRRAIAGPLGRNVAAYGVLVRRQSGGNAERAVAGEGADFEIEFGTDQPRLQRHRLALFGADLHAALRQLRRFLAQALLEIALAQRHGMDIAAQIFGQSERETRPDERSLIETDPEYRRFAPVLGRFKPYRRHAKV